MSETASLPLPYYLCLIAAFALMIQGWQMRMDGYGIPMIAVIGTVAAWYLYDPLYNDYGQYIKEVGENTLTTAWWEVLLFFITLGIAVPVVNRQLNPDSIVENSVVFQMIENREVEERYFQHQIERIGRLILMCWVSLMVIAMMRTDCDYIGLFFPYLGELALPWNRDRLGSGFDFLISFFTYFQIMLTALLGVIFALSLRPGTTIVSGIAYFFAIQIYLFDRTRNVMLAVLLPGFMALVALRLKGGLITRLLVVIVGFTMLEGWFKLVIANRDKMTIADAFQGKGASADELKKTKHLGFNMFEELGYVNYLINNGTYKPNWGARYFAELVNPIPRTLWPGKPLIGIDYAIARGMAYGGIGSASGGIAASISTGMIGQGVVNFGPIFGPIAAAILMAIWIAILARQDIQARQLGHLLLYAIGLVLTFNMGRDITLLVIYPFVFGWLLLYWINKRYADLVIVEPDEEEDLKPKLLV